MTTSTAISTDSLTVKECQEAIDRIFNSSITSENKWLVNKEDIQIAQYGVLNNIHLRDYLMGLPSKYTLEHCVDTLAKIVNVCNKLELEQYPFNVVAGSFHYELGNRAQAILLLSVGLEKQYSLALLLSRVFLANAPTYILSAMRSELHSKVIQQLEDDADKLANEANQ